MDKLVKVKSVSVGTAYGENQDRVVSSFVELENGFIIEVSHMGKPAPRVGDELTITSVKVEYGVEWSEGVGKFQSSAEDSAYFNSQITS